MKFTGDMIIQFLVHRSIVLVTLQLLEPKKYFIVQPSL